MKDNISIPEIGDQIYIDTSLYVTHGVDDFIGGLCEVISVNKIGDKFYITVKEEPDTQHSWDYLSALQEKLKKEFGKSRGHNRPDFRREFNQL